MELSDPYTAEQQQIDTELVIAKLQELKYKLGGESLLQIQGPKSFIFQKKIISL